MNATLKKNLRQLLPRQLKSHRILAGPLRNYRIVTSWHDYPAAILGKTERPLLDWFARNVAPGETWLDIGAHYGYTAMALARLVGAQGRVFAFEPMLTSAGCIAQTRRLNNFTQLTVLPLALGSASRLELEELPLVRGMVDRTLKQQNGSGHPWQETLLVVGLDPIWSTLCGNDARIHGIKLDVQGMELAVLQGMSGLLHEYKPKLVVEVHSGVSRTELNDFVADVGYTQPAVAIEPMAGEMSPQFFDDRSYAFLPEPV
jgi:FkbM family methyltransferase